MGLLLLTSADRLGSARLTYFNWKKKYDGLMPIDATL